MSWSITDRETEESADLEFMEDLQGVKDELIRIAEELQEDINSVNRIKYSQVTEDDLPVLEYYIEELMDQAKELAELNRKLGYIS